MMTNTKTKVYQLPVRLPCGSYGANVFRTADGMLKFMGANPQVETPCWRRIGEGVELFAVMRDALFLELAKVGE